MVQFIGILGGMGPEATAELYLRIIRIFQKNGAKYDSDFPEMIILNLPLPDIVENPKQNQKAKQMLIQGVKKLEKTGATFIAIPCNTVAYFIKDMRKAVKIPILSIPEEVKKITKNYQKLGLLGTKMTINSRMYGKVITPSKEQQKQITEIIMNILSGNKTRKDRKILIRIIKKLKSKGAEKVILGCTELPLLVKNRYDVLDTIEILAEAAVRETNNISCASSKRGGKQNETRK